MFVYLSTRRLLHVRLLHVRLLHVRLLHVRLFHVRLLHVRGIYTLCDHTNFLVLSLLIWGANAHETSVAQLDWSSLRAVSVVLHVRNCFQQP